ncbi:MAG TPA: apolipoprotein N-acyltransferase [Acidimicrobiales bacterium]|nr:apolipoprotein N-acyltransferase [Acidimicrobiales bacterium]
MAGPGGRGGRRVRAAAALVVPSAAAGVALALSLPPWGWWPVAFAGAGLLYWRLAGLGPWARLLAGWVAGLGCYVPGLFWARAFNWYGAVALMAVEALSMAVAGAAVPPVRGRIPVFAGAFTLMEAVRMAWPFGGLPVGGVFLGQADGPLLAAARLGGPLLLTAAVWLGGAGIGELVPRLWMVARGGRWWPGAGGRHGGPASTDAAAPTGPATAPTGPATLATVLAAVAVAGVVAVAVGGVLAPDGGPAVRHLRVAAVQGGGRRGLSQAEVSPATVYTAQLAATFLVHRADGGRPPQLVLWPEDVVSLAGPLAGTPQAATMAGLARQLRATVVAGVTETVSATAFRNLVVAWGPGGRVVGTYEKVHRVPFGEYVPYRGFFAHFADLSAVPLDAVPGHGTGLLRTPAGPMGVMVSYEVFYAARGRSAVRAGARLLLVPTNTSSYATSQVPSQEVAADRLQAVEEGRDLVQAAPTGFSTVVDNRGAVLQRTDLGRRQVLVATVALRSGRTVYEQLGDLPVLVLAGIAVAAGWLWTLFVSGRGRLITGRGRTASPGRAHTAHPEEGSPDIY